MKTILKTCLMTAILVTTGQASEISGGRVDGTIILEDSFKLGISGNLSVYGKIQGPTEEGESATIGLARDATSAQLSVIGQQYYEALDYEKPAYQSGKVMVPSDSPPGAIEGNVTISEGITKTEGVDGLLSTLQTIDPSKDMVALVATSEADASGKTVTLQGSMTGGATDVPGNIGNETTTKYPYPMGFTITGKTKIIGDLSRIKNGVVKISDATVEFAGEKSLPGTAVEVEKSEIVISKTGAVKLGGNMVVSGDSTLKTLAGVYLTVPRGITMLFKTPIITSPVFQYELPYMNPTQMTWQSGEFDESKLTVVMKRDKHISNGCQDEEMMPGMCMEPSHFHQVVDYVHDGVFTYDKKEDPSNPDKFVYKRRQIYAAPEGMEIGASRETALVSYISEDSTYGALGMYRELDTLYIARFSWEETKWIADGSRSGYPHIDTEYGFTTSPYFSVTLYNNRLWMTDNVIRNQFGQDGVNAFENDSIKWIKLGA